jgi:hypothetical protein
MPQQGAVRRSSACWRRADRVALPVAADPLWHPVATAAPPGSPLTPCGTMEHGGEPWRQRRGALCASGACGNPITYHVRLKQP